MREYGWTQQRADSMLALVAMAWGSSYLLMKIGLDGIPPFCIIALRFGIAFIAVSLLFFKKFKKTTKRVMMKGAVPFWTVCVSDAWPSDNIRFQWRFSDKYNRCAGADFSCGDQEENAGSPECFEYSADDDRHLSADSAAVTGVPQR